MKKLRGITKIFVVFVIILLAMISFVGIFVQDKGQIKNILPEYLLGRELKGHRRVELRVSDETQTIKYDAEGKEIAETDTEAEVANEEERKVNPEEVLTKDNYQEVKKIIEKRLEKMQIKDYILRQDENNGNVVLELPETTNTDRVIGQMYLQGKVEIVDKDTNEVLMTNEDIKSVEGGYGTVASGTTVVFVNIQFNEQGTEKFKNITNTYVETKVEKEATEEGKESTEETIKREIEIRIDDSTLLATHFEEEVSNGLLQLSVGASGDNTTAKEMQEYLLEANSMAALLDSGKMPIIYEVEQNQYIFSNITENEIKIIVLVATSILVVGIIYAIVIYKGKGILGGISIIGYIAVLLIALRYFNVEIGIGGIIAILFSIVINYAIVIQILKEKDVLESVKKYSIILIPTLILAIVFTFMDIAMGITLFWGIIIALLYHISVTNILIKD